MDCTKQHLNFIIPTKNSKATTKRPSNGKATIIYLSSLCNPCKNVPSRTAATTTKPYTKIFRANTANGVSSWCCNRWEHENYYEKHAMTPSMTTTIEQLPQQPIKHEKSSLSNINNNYNNNNNNVINNNNNNINNNNIICTSKNSRVSRISLLKHQRYNDLLSTMERAHTSITTTTTTTNTITNKLISFKKDTKYCNLKNQTKSNISACASSMSQNIEQSRLNQQTSKLATRNDIRLLNYARICFTKNNKNNYVSNYNSVDFKNNNPTQIDMPIDNKNGNRLIDIDHQDVSTREEYNRFGIKDPLAAKFMLSKTNITNSQTTTTLSSRCFNNIMDSCSSSTCNRNNDECDADSKLLMNPTARPCRTLDIFMYLLLFLLELFRRKLCQPMKFGSQMFKTFTTTKWLLCITLLMLTSSANCWAGRQDVPTNCTFPARWEGSWFLSGYQQSIHIKGSQFSYRGKCAASDGNKYLIVDEKGCHRCLVIYEKHKNVLQYKESECEGDSIYMHQSNPSALAMRSVLKQTDHRGGAHPNINGHSRLSSSDQYIMRSNDDMNDCPPDFCKGRETLQNLCDQIPGDALLYSLFRESAEPVKCPLKGPFVFTYNRGHGECKSPVSNIESCTEESRLLLSFQACPDVQGTESTVEELTCLATWKDGNSRYLVGLVSHHHAISNEERYRCFVYEKISSLMGGPSVLSTKDAEYKLAQSGDATCNGLDSAEVGSRIMSLRKPPLAERCDFPVWFKGPRHWHGLMGNSVYNYHSNDGSIHIIKSNGYMETRALCEQINKQTSTEMMAVVHYTTGCQSGFMCMMFLRRDTHVIEIQTGKQASRLEDACASDYFDIHKMPYITLLASNPDPQMCPMEGLYNLRGAIGPPYMTTRHKRNHNNKVHAGHGHHHQLNDDANSNSHSTGLAQKRQITLSFRNGGKTLERSAWHANTRGLPVRSRRNTPANDDQFQVPVGATELMLKDDNINQTAIELMLRNRRNVPGCITNFKAQRQLWVGCTEPNVIDVRPLCNDEGDEEYSCHGSWSENGTVHIIARHKSTKHGVCISYRPTEGNSAKLYVGDTCYRGFQKVPDHLLEANLSVFGKCGETGSRSNGKYISSCLVISAVAILTTLIGKLQVNSQACVYR